MPLINWSNPNFSSPLSSISAGKLKIISSPMAIVLFSFIAVLTASILLHLSMAGWETDVVLQKTCGQNRVREGSKHVTNFFDVTKTMHEDMRKRRFAMRKGGESPDQMYVLSQCMNDLSREACDDCFSRSSAMLVDCLSFTSGRIFLGGCFVQFDSYSFFHETTPTSANRKLVIFLIYI